MSSFHHSRARIFFEVCCALGVAVSCVWAWMQTYAPAMLPIAGIAGLYGLVHAFDMRRRKVAAEPAPVLELPIVAPPVERAPVPETRIAEPAAPVVAAEPVIRELPVEALVGPSAKRERKPPRKKTARTKREAEKDASSAIAKPAPIVVEVADEATRAREPQPADFHEPEYAPIAPLFEAEPFVRQHRAAFGRRKAG